MNPVVNPGLNSADSVGLDHHWALAPHQVQRRIHWWMKLRQQADRVIAGRARGELRRTEEATESSGDDDGVIGCDR